MSYSVAGEMDDLPACMGQSNLDINDTMASVERKADHCEQGGGANVQLHTTKARADSGCEEGEN